MTDAKIRAYPKSKIDADMERMFGGDTYTTTARRPDPTDQSLTIEKLYEAMLKASTGRNWRVMKDGIPTNDPETGEPCYYKLAALPEMGTSEIWCASTDAAEFLLSKIKPK